MLRPERRHRFNRAGLPLPVEKVQMRNLDQVLTTRRIGLPHDNEPVTFAQPERAEHDGIEQRPRRSARSQANREAQRGGERHNRPPHHPADTLQKRPEHHFPIANNASSARMNRRPPAIAGDASWRASSRLRARILRRAARGDDDGLAVLAHQIDLAVAGDRRRGVDAADALLVHALAGLGVGDGEHADVAHHVDQAVVVDERRDVRRRPSCACHVHVARRDVAFPARPNRHERAAAIAAARVDDARRERAASESGTGWLPRSATAVRRSRGRAR